MSTINNKTMVKCDKCGKTAPASEMYDKDNRWYIVKGSANYWKSNSSFCADFCYECYSQLVSDLGYKPPEPPKNKNGAWWFDKKD